MATRYHEGPAVAISLSSGSRSQRVVVSQTKMNNGNGPSVTLDGWSGQFLLLGAISACVDAFVLNRRIYA